MSLSQWTIANDTVSTGNSSSASIQSSTVIEGASSLRLRYNASGAPSNGTNDGIMLGLTSGAGVTTGKIRTLYEGTVNSSTPTWGLWCMMQTSIAFSRSCYFTTTSMGTGSNSISLFKGTLNYQGTALASGTAPATIAQSTVYAQELKWQLDTSANQMLLTLSCSAGSVSSPSSYTYNDLAPRITFTDVSPLTTGVSAGLWIGTVGGGVLDFSVFLDKTQIWTP